MHRIHVHTETLHRNITYVYIQEAGEVEHKNRVVELQRVWALATVVCFSTPSMLIGGID